jgi:ABC-type multidrug transport system permease subunit
MDVTRILTATFSISTTDVVGGSTAVGTVDVSLPVDPVQLLGVALGLLVFSAIFLFVNKFQQWALLLVLTAALVWLPLSITTLSIASAAVVLFFVLVAAALRAIGQLFWR